MLYYILYIYCYLILYYTIIILYLILYSSLLLIYLLFLLLFPFLSYLPPSLPLPILIFFPSKSSFLISSSPLPIFLFLIYYLLFHLLSIILPSFQSSINLIHSIRVGIWISLFIFHKNLTPHVLSEWMVEVCRFEQYRFMFRAGVMC